MLAQQLEEFGLNDKEARVYIATLELGQGSAADIAKKSGVNRATTYFTLESLMKMGLVSASSAEKVQMFIPEDPAQLENIITKQQQALEVKKRSLTGLVRELNSINSAGVKKPIVKYYLGKEGIMRMASASFDEVRDEEMWLAFSKDDLDEFLKKEENDKLIQKRISHNNKSIALYNSEVLTLDNDEKNTRIRVRKESYYFPADIAVYKDKVRLTSYKDKIGIIIENKDIAHSLKSLFQLAVHAAKIKNS